MPFDLKIVFTGLVLVCTPGHEPCKEAGDQGIAYLVNATHGKEICSRWMDGGHRPLLAFDERHLLPGSTPSYEYIPQPDGERSVVADLRGIELCVCTAAPGQSADCEARQVEREKGRDPGQTHPKWSKWGDADDFTWIASLPGADGRVEDCGYRKEVNGPLRSGSGFNDSIIARVHLSGGTVGVQGCERRQIPELLPRVRDYLFARAYVLWSLTGGQPPPETDFPKALPEQVVWTIEDIPNDQLVLFQTCGGEDHPARTLFRLKRAGVFRDMEVHISNLPSKSVQSTAGPHLEHFRWFYSLVDWGSPDPGCTDCRNLDIALPTQQTLPPLEPNAIWGVTSKTVNCSPGRSG